MGIILALFTSIVIYLAFKVLETRFVQFNFTFHELILGNFNIKNTLTAIIIPFAAALIFGLIYESAIPAVYTIPGFLAAILIVWPYFRNPENIPENMQLERERAYIVYLFFIVSFTLFSYLGGYVGSQGLPSFLPSTRGIVDGFWIVVFGALFTHFAHKFLNRKLPPQSIKKTDVNIPKEDSKPLQT